MYNQYQDNLDIDRTKEWMADSVDKISEISIESGEDCMQCGNGTWLKLIESYNLNRFYEFCSYCHLVDKL